MKARLLIVLFLVAALLALLTVTVSAQRPEPPTGPKLSGPPPQPSAACDWEGPKRSECLAALRRQASAQGVSPAVTLGKPGTSFRYVQTFGVTEQAYPADTQHLNAPAGLFVDGGNNLYVVEELGHRMLKFDSSGNSVPPLLGTAGSHYIDNYVFDAPRGVAVDGSGNIWVVDNHRLTEFDSSGNYLRVFPTWDNQPWNCGIDNGHFCTPSGIAFDASGKMYVSDADNHRIQVFQIVSGAPVYDTTIGEPGVSGSDNSHFNRPWSIAFDSSGRLYVVDTSNYRVQRCTFSGGWTCSTFFGVTGTPGSDLTHMEWAFGIGIDNSDNIYIADSGNYRVLKCDTSATCALFAGVTGEGGTDNSHFWWPAYVAADASGHVYVSDWSNFRIQNFDSSGTYLSTLGTTGIPYVTDATHYNSPWGVVVAADGSIYLTENRGMRLIKLNAAGAQVWAVGQAGVWGGDNAHFGAFWTGPEGNLAIDASKRIYVPDTGNHRVQIFNPNGTYYATMGVTGESGTDNAHFNCPAGVAIRSSNGDIFVLDRCNQRVQVFDKNRKYKATIGVTGVSGSDNAHFNYPWGIAVDTSGTIYVGDSENHRVQKCNLTKTSYTCSTFAGVTGVSGSDYGHFAHPMGVAVDKSKNVYVVDEWNNRVQVFDSKGAYLTTIGGSWGPNTSQMRDPRGVAVDSKGNVYVTDWTNHRVQKFALGVPNWKQVNINGFGDAYSDTGRSLAVFGNYLYATSSSSSTGGIWRMSKSGTWTSVMANGFGVANNYIEYLFPFNGNLYATTQNQTSGGQVWRSSDGTAWNQVVTGGFGKATNWDVFRLAVFNNQIYAGTVSSDTMHGLEIWRSSTGNLNDWQQVVPDGFGDVNNSQVGAFVMFNNQLYVGTTNNTSGGELWRSSTGASGSWTQVNTDGFGSVYNRAISALAIYNGYLYAGTRNLHDGGEVWRSSDGTTWTRAASGGQGNVNNGRAYGLFVYKGKLYLVFANLVDGAEIWQTSNGTTWTSVMTGGWGNSNNGYADYWNAGTAIFNNRLYVGVINSAGGGEVWQYLK